ncbi:MAG: YebC/PmpR family DNA-binding transcriptional regulator [Acidobacteriota bacterium]|nr:YebC/PmpR family DNA-binding transcriptional regulator [Acidobacteriota bacterium]
MAGHSKWANIQHRKGREDAKRAKLFTKLGREITVSARMGGPDPDANPRLRAAIQEARKNSMPNDNVKRAIDKGAGGGDTGAMEELTYEGYGAGGVAFLVEAMTDNKNRTVPELRHIFSKCGGNLGESGSVAWQFQRTGYISVPKGDKTEDDMTDIILEAGAEDLEDAGDFWGVTTASDELHTVAKALEEQGLEYESAKLVMIPTTEITISGDTLTKVMRLMEMLDDQDDVQNVFNNADFDEAELAS